jgi:hypothetical protein
MIKKSTTFTTIFRVKKCYFRYEFACKKVPLSLRYAKNTIFFFLFWIQNKKQVIYCCKYFQAPFSLKKLLLK